MKKILDVCCGGKMMWFDRKHPAALFMDKRIMEKQIIWKSKDGKEQRYFEVSPDKVGDFRKIDEPDESFYLVVFDPPHLTNAGDNSWIFKKYGRLEKTTWQSDLAQGFSECWRVLKPNGTLIFKWNEESVSIKEILALFPQQPLFGHPTAKHGKTKWFTFFKDSD